MSSILSNGTGLHDFLATSPDDAQPDWSNDGRLALISVVTGDPDIYVMNADGTGLTDITNDPSVDLYPAFSPDGTEIVFTHLHGRTSRPGSAPRVEGIHQRQPTGLGQLARRQVPSSFADLTGL